jgi:tripartite-type tricarboxylate transporter receptor subunit TctC
MWKARGVLLTSLMAACPLVSGAAPLRADPVSDFYAGKQIQFIVRTTPGGDYDLLSRVLARFMGKYIPGHPSFIVSNMPGGGGIAAANYMSEVAPHDGTVIGIVSQGLPVDQALHLSPPLRADMRAFNWIANVNFSNQLLVVWNTSPTKTLEEAKKRETLIGTTGAGSASVQYPAFFNNVLGTRFKIVFGYPGGREIDLAMERGEVEGRGINPYDGYMSSEPTWIPEKKVIPLIQVGPEKEPALPDVPLLLDQPVKAEDRALLEFMSQSSAVGRPLATTPGVPAERVAALRNAFQQTIKDEEFKAAIAAQHLNTRSMPGDKLQSLIASLLSASADVRDRMKIALEPNSDHVVQQARP